MSTYNSPIDVVPATLVRSSNTNDLDAAVANAFALLPDETLLKQGKVMYAEDTGTANTYIATLPVSPVGYVDGLALTFKADNANTGACTVNVNTLGVKAIAREDGTDLVSGDIVAGQMCTIRYSTTSGKFQLEGTNASSSASAAAASAATATSQASAASASAIAAALSESNAASSAGSASTSAGTATTKASEANASAIAAAASEAAAAASYDSFDDRYLGAKASAPTVDNDGNALITGALYFNTTTNYTYVRTAGGAWQLLTQVAGVSSLNGQTGDLTLNGGAVADFLASGTYTVPTTATFVEVHAYGAGGGGASGRRGASSSLRTGGGGGGGGALVTRRFKVSEITSTVAVTIGAGGAGGAAVTANDTNGNAGSIGGNSTFGSYVTAYGGAGGAGGTATTATGGGGGGVSGAGASNGTGGSPLVTTASGTTQQFGGGGGGSSASSGKNSTYGGGGGGYEDTTNQAGGTSVFAGGGGAGGAGISASNTIIVTMEAGGTNGAASTNTSNQLAINGVAGAAYTGGQGGSAVVLNTSLQFTQVAFGNSKYVALSLVAGTGNYLISTSTNGTTGWDVQPLPTTTFIPTNHFYDGSKWVFYGATQIYTTTDLVNFTLRTAPFANLAHIAFAGGLYVAVGAGGTISTSTDLITWTARTSGTGQSLWAVTHNGTKWIVVGNTGVTLTSTDAITWTLVTVSGTPNFYSIAANGASLVAHSNTSPFAHYSTDTGATWTAATTVLASGASVTNNKGLTYAGGRFVCISGSALYTSTDGGINWTTQTDGTTDTYSGIAHDGTTYVVGSNTANGNVCISSTDAAAWTARTFTDGRTHAAGNGGAGGIAAGGGGGAASLNGTNSGAGAAGGNGFIRVFSW
jgi:hypothetical protein